MMNRNRKHTIGVKTGLEISKACWSLCYDLYYYFDDENNNRWVLKRNGDFVQYEQCCIMKPSFSISFDVEHETHFLQELFDSMYMCGFRPTTGDDKKTLELIKEIRTLNKHFKADMKFDVNEVMSQCYEWMNKHGLIKCDIKQTEKNELTPKLYSKEELDEMIEENLTDENKFNQEYQHIQIIDDGEEDKKSKILAKARKIISESDLAKDDEE